MRRLLHSITNQKQDDSFLNCAVNMLEATCIVWKDLSEQDKEQVMLTCEKCIGDAMRHEHNQMLQEKTNNGGKCKTHQEITPKGKMMLWAVSVYTQLLKLQNEKAYDPV